VTDRRTRFATDRVAADELRGTVESSVLVKPWSVSVDSPSTFLHAAPGGHRDREVFYGDRVDLIEDRAGWCFGRVAKDGYCGWFHSGDIGPEIVPTHAVRVRHTHVYPEPSAKAPPLMRLPFAANVRIDETDGRWARSPVGWIYARHIGPVESPLADPVSVAELFVGTPYLWAGNTDEGIDCSGLVQVACLACGIVCPGDSDQQERTLGNLLHDAASRRGDLLFWRGHVAWVSDGETILHANAHDMAVTYEPMGPAIERIESQGDGAVTSRRRL
jgi:cell wall-associated NlpC family hydrolase